MGSVLAAIAQRNASRGRARHPVMKSSWSRRRTASWSASVVGGCAARAAGSSIPSATAWVISSSHSRSLGAACAGGAAGAGGRGRGAAGEPGPPEHAATTRQAIHRTMHRC
jgi:hypothetical protein